MKRLKDVLAALVGISFLMFALGRLSYAQPNIPKEKIPSDIPSDVREQIERLCSPNPAVRYKATESLGEMGAKAASAVPFLVAVLKDEDLGILQEDAALALGRIKDPRAVEPLIVALKDEDWRVREGAARALGER